MGAYSGGFTRLTFTVAEGATTLLTKTFTTLSAAQTYFSDDPVSLGDITGAVDLKLTYKLTANAAEGAGISYLVADAPVGGDGVPGDTIADARAQAHPHQTTMIGSKHSPGLFTILWKFDAADAATGQDAPKFLLRIPEQRRVAQLAKGQHR